jgi:hypothetical protein
MSFAVAAGTEEVAVEETQLPMFGIQINLSKTL